MNIGKLTFTAWIKSNGTAYDVSVKSGVPLSTIQKLSSAGRVPLRSTLNKLKEAYPDEITLAMFE